MHLRFIYSYHRAFNNITFRFDKCILCDNLTLNRSDWRWKTGWRNCNANWERTFSSPLWATKLTWTASMCRWRLPRGRCIHLQWIFKLFTKFISYSYAKSVGARHFQTSAKENIGVEDLFLELTNMVSALSRFLVQDMSHIRWRYIVWNDDEITFDLCDTLE